MENSQDKLLKIAETDIRFVGKGLALVDPESYGTSSTW